MDSSKQGDQHNYQLNTNSIYGMLYYKNKDKKSDYFHWKIYIWTGQGKYNNYEQY